MNKKINVMRVYENVLVLCTCPGKNNKRYIGATT